MLGHSLILGQSNFAEIERKMVDKSPLNDVGNGKTNLVKARRHQVRVVNRDRSKFVPVTFPVQPCIGKRLGSIPRQQIPPSVYKVALTKKLMHIAKVSRCDNR